MTKCIDTHIGLAAQPYVEDLSLDKYLEIAGGNYRLYTACALKNKVTRSRSPIYTEVTRSTRSVGLPPAHCKTEITRSLYRKNK